jgi:cobalt-zinc-cadmium efflux system outer membrane protein
MAIPKALVLSGLLVLSCNSFAAERSADPKLAQFVKTVVDTHPQVRAAQAALEASGARKHAASRPLYNPEFSVDAENSDTQTRSLGISQTLDWGGKRTARTAVAESERLAVEAGYLAVRWNVTTLVLAGLANHQTSVKRDALAVARVSLMTEFASLAERRFQAGDLTQVEQDLASLAATGARMQRATVVADLAEARQLLLSQAPNSQPQHWPSLPTQLPQLPPSAKEPERLVLMLPSVQVAQRKVDVAKATVELRRRERRPDPTISLAGGEEDDHTLFGLNLSIPLPIRNRFGHEVTAAIADQSQARALADDVMRRAYARLVSAGERYQFSNGAWADWELTGRSSLSRQGDQLRRLWEAGEISSTDYLVQVQQTLDVQEAALDLRQALWKAWFEWLEASGQVDVWLTR